MNVFWWILLNLSSRDVQAAELAGGGCEMYTSMLENEIGSSDSGCIIISLPKDTTKGAVWERTIDGLGV